ncbi:MAG: formylglycine-generating enzyme family protein [Smithellaceae bacterium]|nr:formylglycine-generating enzyme family protein [Smithellaceae bacterium]
MKKGCIGLLALVLFFAGSAALGAAEVKNVVAAQVGNRVQFTYDLAGEEREAEVTVIVTVQGAARQTAELRLEGDVGKVKPGRGKVIWWNVLQDFPRGLNAEIVWEITAGGQPFTETATGMEFLFVKGGCYDMGDAFGDGGADEKPVHNVCVADFYLGKYEVTVGQFRAFVQDANYRTEAERGDGCFIWTGSKWEKDGSKSWRSPGFSQDESHPVVCVSWNDTQAFNDWLSRKVGKIYRLPTEAQWEYAARSGGKREKWAGTSEESSLGNFAWYTANSGNRTRPVGQKQPNGLGFYDLTGNVWEWCQDWYGEKYYAGSPRDNPQGASSGQYRVLRGGSWFFNPRDVRGAYRVRNDPAARSSNLGFRLALSAP